MTIQSLSWAFDQPIPGTAKLVLLGLSNHADDATGFIHFDAPTIARIAMIPVSSLWRYLGALERNQYLDKDERSDGRKYYLVFDRESSAPWTWGKDCQGLDGADFESVALQPPAPRRTDQPMNFSQSRQTEARKAATPLPDNPGIPIIEGSKAFEAWQRYYLSRREVRPYVRSIRLSDGRYCRGFYMPSLFPPREDRIDDLEGAA